MRDILDRQTRLTIGQWKIMAAATARPTALPG